jgi:hypothetical protein
MMTIPVHLATEDELSEAVLRRILTHIKRGYAVGVAYRHGGFGYLRRTVPGWNRAAKGQPFVLLTDLDKYACPKALIADWLPVPLHPNLLFRVAVREVESWLPADKVNLALYFGISDQRVPKDADALADAKAVLIDLARRSRLRELRNGIVPKRGSTAQQGPDYNGRLIPFVQNSWDVRAAANNSPSLARTVERLKIFRPTWHVGNKANSSKR